MLISHIAIWTRNYEDTKRFYINTLGLEKSWESIDDEGVYNLYVSGNTDAEIQFKYDPKNEREISPETIDHLAINTNDLNSKLSKLMMEDNTNVIKSPITKQTRRGYKAKLALIEDPTGYIVELVQRLD